MPLIDIPKNSDFSIHNIPFGIISHPSLDQKHIATAIGDYVIPLKILDNLAFFHDIEGLQSNSLQSDTLNDFIAQGKKVTSAIRQRLIEIFSAEDYMAAKELKKYFLIPISEVTMHLPVKIGDYTDFYSSREHATNVGIMFRDPANALLPNWLHLPVGYHGRASSIVVSDTPIRRPKGQTLPPDATIPIFGESHRLDFELEMAFVIGKSSHMGDEITIEKAEDYIFGMTIFNDWSARDIQQWEYVPLGPFLGKNFASTMSPWIVTMEALEPFRCAGPIQEPQVLPYLACNKAYNYDIQLEVAIKPENNTTTVVTNSNYKYMYWNMAQQLAHHTINGCNMNIGDVMASGTISGPTPDSYGSMLEIAWKGTRAITLNDGTVRRFIHDGDTVIMRAWAERDGVRVGFGEANGKILPAK